MSYYRKHWSQRLREQQAVYSSHPVLTPLAVPVSRNSRPRSKVPKPPRDERAEQLLCLCREGRLFELQEWAAAGKPVTVPTSYRQTPLRVALDTGFHSLIEFLLRHETDQARKDDALMRATWNGQPSVMELALQCGANVDAVPFHDVLETFDRHIVQVFLDHGGNPVTNAPFARAFKKRAKPVLGSFLDCKRDRPQFTAALQEQADMALRQACADDDVKWVSLLMWLGANPRSRGLSTDDIDDTDAAGNAEYVRSAMEIACSSRKPQILKLLKPDPSVDDLRMLMAAAASFSTVPETVAYLMSLGADLNDKSDGGSSVLDACLRYFGWREAVWDRPPYTPNAPIVTASRLAEPLKALRRLVDAGARWTPDDRTVADTRRALYKLEDEAVAAVVDLLRTPGVCEEATLAAFVGTGKMRGILAGVVKRRVNAQRDPESAKQHVPARRGSAAVQPSPPPLPPSRYNRRRLYEEVWTEPTRDVAKRYGVSDVAITKACRLLDIPKPPRGYWAKKAAGLTVPAKPSLPQRSLEDGSFAVVRDYGER
jgi:hypothetical protein